MVTMVTSQTNKWYAQQGTSGMAVGPHTWDSLMKHMGGHINALLLHVYPGRFMGSTCGPPQQDPGGPHVGSMNLAIRVANKVFQQNEKHLKRELQLVYTYQIYLTECHYMLSTTNSWQNITAYFADVTYLKVTNMFQMKRPLSPYCGYNREVLSSYSPITAGQQQSSGHYEKILAVINIYRGYLRQIGQLGKIALDITTAMVPEGNNIPQLIAIESVKTTSTEKEVQWYKNQELWCEDETNKTQSIIILWNIEMMLYERRKCHWHLWTIGE